MSLEVIATLKQLGVELFLLGPGSRCTPFSIALHRLKIPTFIHFDERALAFYALGYAKKNKKPAALMTTSGSAVVNLFPAVMEAYHTETPLLLLTADRPYDLRDTGANQTTDQTKIFGSFVKGYFDFPLQKKEDLPFLVAQLAYLTHQAQKGPVHLNFMYKEPFDLTPSLSPLPPIPHYQTLESTTPCQNLSFLKEKKRVILIQATLLDTPLQERLDAWALRENIPIFADIESMRRGLFKPPYIPYYEALLKREAFPECDLVLQIGPRFLSKTLHQYVQKAKKHALFLSTLKKADCHHTATEYCIGSLDSLLNSFLDADPSWLQEWREKNSHYDLYLKQYFQKEERLTELSAIRTVLENIPPSYTLFLGTSLPVREGFALMPDVGPQEIFANRGVSGIDGLIATSAGLSHSSTGVIALIGDQSALFDLNALALLPKLQSPLILIVVNNGGGGIFSFLPAMKSDPSLKDFFLNPHSFTFESFAKGFGVPYQHPQTLCDLKKSISFFHKQKCSGVIELTVTLQETLNEHAHLFSPS